MPKKSSTEKEIQYLCSRCGKTSPVEQYFYKSYSILHIGTGVLPICRECANKMFKVYTEKYGDPVKAMQRLCMSFDMYFDKTLFHKCYNTEEDVLANYIARLNLVQHRGKTFENCLSDGFEFGNKQKNRSIPKKETSTEDELQEEPINPKDIKTWGDGFSATDYGVMNEHYSLLKSANPNCDSNQEIFINDLCYIKMLQTRAAREGRTDDFSKMTESYRKSFQQAGLKTVQSADANSEDCWGVWMARIAQYTPEEYYKNKKLFKDADGIGDYFNRLVLRPLRNLVHGTQDRDHEFCVKDNGDEDDYSESD